MKSALKGHEATYLLGSVSNFAVILDFCLLNFVTFKTVELEQILRNGTVIFLIIHASLYEQ